MVVRRPFWVRWIGWALGAFVVAVVLLHAYVGATILWWREHPPRETAFMSSRLAELRAANAHDKHATVPLDEHWLSWAAEERLFDAEEGQDDWIRFHSLWTRLRLLTSRAEEALTAVREAERGGELPPAEAAQLLSMALEDLGDLPRAGAEARRRLEALEKPWPVGDVVRTAHLLGTKELLEEAANQWPTDSDEAEMLRGAAGISPVVQLGKKG